MNNPAWLPDIIRLIDHGGDWRKYIDAVYSVFHRDFIASQPQLRGQQVGCRHQPLDQGQEFTFWHCVSEGAVELNRSPDLRRCERVPWIRPIVEHEHEQDATVEVWQHRKNRDERLYLWFNEEYLVVLGIRHKHFMLITAFPTDREHTRKKLRNERDKTRSPKN